MAANELSTYVGGIGEKSVEGAFACLLRLTGDAVVAFDGGGSILFVNDQADRLFYHPWGSLEGADVRLLFPPAIGVAPSAPFTSASLPFELDGAARVLTCVGSAGQSIQIRVRCDEVRAPGTTYLLVARPNDTLEAAQGEHDRLVEELSRANKRLSGTLDIVLGTIDSTDVKSLFTRALNAIVETMEADGSVMYLAEHDGFHLRGTSEGLDRNHVSRFIPYGRMIETLVTREGHALRLRVLPPQSAELRHGKLVSRRVVDEETHHIHKVLSVALPPFSSFLAVPVWFGGHMIALIEVGWRNARPMRRDDAQLLDAVAQYLSVQLMGAFSAMRAKKSNQLAALSSRLREKVMAADHLDAELLDGVLAQAASELDTQLVTLVPEEDGFRLHNYDAGSLAAQEDATLSGAGPNRTGNINTQIALPHRQEPVIPAELLQTSTSVSQMDNARPGGSSTSSRASIIATPGACALGTLEGLSSWLSKHGMGSVGALVNFGVVEGKSYLALLLRDGMSSAYGEPEPMSSIELGFLNEFAVDVSELVVGGEARAQDKHIAQALQSGMQNELQKVEGITAEGLYSSATEQAFVGGDFYDLIRLPGRQACVIMGDVSGKGVEAASVSAAVRTALGAYAWEGLRPARMVRSLNDFLLGFSRLETFATLFVGIIDLEKSTLTYCSAGHPPALLLRADTGEIIQLDVQSGVVGAFKDMLYQDGAIDLCKGDMLLLYTDGTTEARAPSGAFFGEDGLRDAVMREWQKGFEGIPQRLLSTLDRFTGNNLNDDVAIVALRFDGAEG